MENIYYYKNIRINLWAKMTHRPAVNVYSADADLDVLSSVSLY